MKAEPRPRLERRPLPQPRCALHQRPRLRRVERRRLCSVEPRPLVRVRQPATGSLREYWKGLGLPRGAPRRRLP
jgi:hypothetical protein